MGYNDILEGTALIISSITECMLLSVEAVLHTHNSVYTKTLDERDVSKYCFMLNF